MKNNYYYTALYCLLLCTQKINAQSVNVLNNTDTVIAANTIYNDAGMMKRIFLGDHYRKVWAEPVALKILNLDSVAGGLTPIKLGGGMQTKSLRLKGADGKEYVLRSVNKDPSKVMPPEFVGTFAADIVQDQISSSNPYAPLAVAALAATAGILHTNPCIVFLPASERLGDFAKEFGNSVCLFEERPTGDQQSAASFNHANNIVNSAKLFEKVFRDPKHRVDEKSFLKSRLFDIWIGDWDRHEDQWLWASYKEDGKTIYRPIARDRDQAFASLDGIIPQLASKPWAVRRTKNFDYKIHDINGLNMAGAYLDRNFTTTLSLQDWRDVAKDLQQKLTDEKIETAFKFFPANIYELSAKKIIAKLKQRRNDLAEYASTYYHFVSKDVSIVGTSKQEFFEVKKLNNDSTSVIVYTDAMNKQQSAVSYERIFSRNETKEIRLYGLGGDDHFEIEDNGKKSFLIRVIGGDGRDSVIQNSYAGGEHGNVKVYDNDQYTYTNGKGLNKYISTDTLKNKYNRAGFKYDWFAPKLSPGYNPDDGYYFGGGIVYKKQQFGKAPFGYMQALWGNYAVATGAYNFWYKGIYTDVMGKWDLHLNAQINAPNYTLNYYGAGNETVKLDTTSDYYRVRAKQYIVSPSLARKFGNNHTMNFGLEYQSVKIEKNENRFITDGHAKLDSSVFNHKQFGGLTFNYKFNNTGNLLYPRKGMIINSGVELIHSLSESNTNFVRLSSDASFFFTHKSLTAAIKIGGATNLGDDYEFYQANTLGGTDNLRGYRRSRFTGEKSIYQNTELRYKLQTMKGYVFRGNWGLLAFFDNGRVWIPEETSHTWHYSYGGGIWFLPYNKIAFTATYGVSNEDKLLNIKAGFFL